MQADSEDIQLNMQKETSSHVFSYQKTFVPRFSETLMMMQKFDSEAAQ